VKVDYKSSGVDLEAAHESTQKIGKVAQDTFDKNVLNGIGLFAGFYAVDLQKYPEPVVVTSIDGVGTKLKVAFMMNRHHSVGQDLVNHCVNDIMTCGADPVAFTDYIGTLQLDPEHIKAIVAGMAKACSENNCALIGGETAEMPGFYSPGEYDLAGSIIGLVNRQQIIDGKNIEKGDVLIGLPSTGLHTNGYSLARKIVFEVAGKKPQKIDPELGRSWGDALLAVHKSYIKPIQKVRFLPGVNGISHITGGGIEGNTNRLLRGDLKLNVDWDAWQIPQVFKSLQALGEITDEEMRRAFNIGIGLIFIVNPQEKANIVKTLHDMGESPIVMGNIN